jgi:type IV pilus assembly protein PilM
LSAEKVTLHIEDTEVRLLIARRDGVERWGNMPLEPGVVSEGLMVDASRLRPALDLIFSKHRARRNGVTVGLSGLRSVTRLISIPKMKPSLVGSAILQESKREMPVPVETLYLLWQAIAATEGEQRFFVLGVPRELVDANVATLHRCGIKPRSMDLKPLALIRAVNKGEAIVADLEAGSFDIIVVAGGLPAITRSMVLRPGLGLEERVGRLLDELSRMVRFYNTGNPGSPLGDSTPLYLTGRLGGESEVSELIASRVAYKVEALAPPFKCPPGFPFAEYMVNVGLALKRS